MSIKRLYIFIMDDDDHNKDNNKNENKRKPDSYRNGFYKEEDHNEDNDNGNIVEFRTLAERDKARQKEEQNHAPSEPLINLPPVTKYFLGAIIGIHLIVSYLLSPVQSYWVMTHFGFVPGAFTGNAEFTVWALISPLTYMLLHGGWLHIAMNGVMMMAFGSATERWVGPKHLISSMIFCGLAGIAAHFALFSGSTTPVVGASGALSGLFAIMITLLNRSGGIGFAGGRFGVLPFVFLWIGITLLFGMLGSPDGASVAWAAHLGGFLAGFVYLKWMKI